MVEPRFPFPVIGGDKLQAYYLMKYLSKHYELILVSLYETEEERVASPEEGLFKEVYKIRQPKWRSRFQTLKAIPANKSLQAAYFSNPELHEVMNKLAPTCNLLLAHTIRAVEYITPFGDIPKVCNMVDAISMTYMRAAMFKRLSMKNVLYRVEQGRSLKYELECLKQLDLCFLVSTVDRDFLYEKSRTTFENIKVIPNGVDQDKFCFRNPQKTKEALRNKKMIFVGNMRTEPNIDAVLFFSKDIFPQIKKKYPESTFWIVGANPPKEVLNLQSVEGINVTGKVDRVEDYCYDAAVSICPIRIGAGIQNKVLESMAMGIPVIASPVGIEGLRVKDGETILAASSPDEYVMKISQLFENTDLAVRISEQARQCIEQDYSWDNLLNGYKEAFDELMGNVWHKA